MLSEFCLDQRTETDRDNTMEGCRMSLLVAMVTCLVVGIQGHGRMIQPPGRATMWRYGFDNPINNVDHGMNCGGFDYHQNIMQGKCGFCGDKWDDPVREHEAGGLYANGIIVDTYSAGQVIDATLQITQNHKGYHEFRLCVNNDPSKPITQECLDENLLELADGSGTRWYWEEGHGNDNYTIPLLLPPGVTCSQCVLQWDWTCGNRWGTDDDGNSCVGCGTQEHFYSCADVTINA